MRCAEQCRLIKTEWHGYREALGRTCAPARRKSLGNPFFGVITIPTSI